MGFGISYDLEKVRVSLKDIDSDIEALKKLWFNKHGWTMNDYMINDLRKHYKDHVNEIKDMIRSKDISRSRINACRY